MRPERGPQGRRATASAAAAISGAAESAPATSIWCSRIVVPPPGFAPHTEFTLEPVGGADGLFRLDAVDDEALRLYVVDPQTVVDGYAPVLADEHVADLVVSGRLLLLFVDEDRLALDTHHHLVLGSLEVIHRDLLSVAAGCEERSLVDEVRKVST